MVLCRAHRPDTSTPLALRPEQHIPITYDAPPMNPLALSVRVERWPIAGSFTISRGAKTEAVVVVAELADGTHRGRGECVPYARYGETVEGVTAAREGEGAGHPPG